MSDDLYARLRSAYCAKDDEVPKGYKSRRQWQSEWRCSRTKAKDMLAAGVENGIMAKVELRIGGRRVPYYGELKKR